MSKSTTMNKKPAISIIIPTYNRAHIVTRAIESILAQKFTDYEIIVVDDGSKDDTLEVLKQYADLPNFRIVQHEVNKGAVGAKNTGFDNIQGEWFTVLDSDDEMTPDALESFFSVLETVDPDIDAITCNCKDTTTGEFSGKGLHGDQYLDPKTIVSKCTGEYWGITKTELLGDKRLNENHPSHDVLWFKINAIAKRYYLHKALRIYYTDGADRVTLQRKENAKNIKKTAREYRVLKEELFFLSEMEKYNPDKFLKICIQAYVTNWIDNDKDTAAFYWDRLQNMSNLKPSQKILLQILSLLPTSFLKRIMPYKSKFKALFVRQKQIAG